MIVVVHQVNFNLNYRELQMKKIWNKKIIGLVISIMALSLVFASCKKEEEEDVTSESEETVSTPTVSMGLPSSLTGDKNAQSSQNEHPFANAMNVLGGPQYSSDGDPNCNFGDSTEDVFRNGYVTTKFLVGASATWTCMADFLMAFGQWESQFTTDGNFIVTTPTKTDDPTGMKLTRNSTTQKTMEFYYNDSTTAVGWYFSWDIATSATTGKMILSGSDLGTSSDPSNDNNIANLRIDFTKTSTEQTTDFFLQYDPDNEWKANGFRANIIKDLTVDSSSKTLFIAKGLLDFSAQPASNTDTTMDSLISEAPVYKIYTISDQDGLGGAIALINDWGVNLNSWTTYGYYIFSRSDRYLFTALGTSEYVNKDATFATYKGGGSNPPSYCLPQDQPLSACGDMFDPWFQLGDNGQEINSGSVPSGDTRQTYLNTVTEDGAGGTPSYLNSVYPTGSTGWTGAFDMSFTP